MSNAYRVYVKRWGIGAGVLAVALLLSGSVFAQQPVSNTPAVPRLVRFNGSYHNVNQSAEPGVIGITFSIYREQSDGTPLWSEIQNVQPDKDGNYSILLGSTSSEGMPVDLFTSSESRWLEVEVDQVKQARIRLGSVPYALKSVDADTLGGLPPSAYLRVNPANAATSTANTVVAAGLSPLFNSSGAQNTLPVFVDGSGDLGNSVITQSGNTVSIGGNNSLGALTLIGNVPFGDTAGMALYNAGGGALASVSLDMYNTSYNGGIPQAKIKAFDDGNYSDHLTFWTKVPGAQNNPVNERMRLTSTGSLGIGTTTPSAKLEVNGNLKIDGPLIFPDGTSQSTAGGGGSGGGATITVGTTTTLPAGSNATVQNVGNSTNAIFNFGIPQGIQGPAGSSGSSSTITLAAGSAGSPSLNFSGNTNTGIYSSGTNAVNITTNGANRLQVRSDGDVDHTGNIRQNGTLWLHTLGNQNTSVGLGALLPTGLTGQANTAVGFNAMDTALAITGSNNTAVGAGAGFGFALANQNTAIGSNAMNGTNPGANNTALGFNALNSVSGNPNGQWNTGLGTQTLSSITSGSYNTAIGFADVNGTFTGSGSSLSSGADTNVDIMSAGVAGDNNVLRIGDVLGNPGSGGLLSKAFIGGIRGVTTGSSNAVTVVIDSNGQLGTVNSSRRFKEDIQDMGETSDRLMRLRPVTYRYKQPYADGEKPLDYGLIAEEVAEVYPDLVVRSNDGQIETVQYQKLTPMLLNEVQKQSAVIQSLEAKVAALQQAIEKLAGGK